MKFIHLISCFYWSIRFGTSINLTIRSTRYYSSSLSNWLIDCLKCQMRAAYRSGSLQASASLGCVLVFVFAALQKSCTTLAHDWVSRSGKLQYDATSQLFSSAHDVKLRTIRMIKLWLSRYELWIWRARCSHDIIISQTLSIFNKITTTFRLKWDAKITMRYRRPPSITVQLLVFLDALRRSIVNYPAPLLSDNVTRLDFIHELI